MRAGRRNLQHAIPRVDQRVAGEGLDIPEQQDGEGEKSKCWQADPHLQFGVAQPQNITTASLLELWAGALTSDHAVASGSTHILKITWNDFSTLT